MSSCCDTQPEPDIDGNIAKPKPDLLLWGSLVGVTVLYFAQFFASEQLASIAWLSSMSSTSFELINIMWWSMALSVVFVGVLDRIPREFVMSILGDGDGFKGLVRATMAGVFLDLCSHGILMVGMKLYERGASLAQVIAFLVASPWNSISLTFILFALIGIQWTLLFILFSMIIALISGTIFQMLVKKGVLPENKNKPDLPADFNFKTEAKTQLSDFKFDGEYVSSVLVGGIKGSRMVMRWILFGVLLAGVIRSIMSGDDFALYFGASAMGLALTLLAATIIEICSEGSTPLAADLVTRAGAPGNAFTFLMAGVATDYTEIMSIKDTTGSWKIALFLPLVTVPQVLTIGWLMNVYGA
jgi:hypothetical protein